MFDFNDAEGQIDLSELIPENTYVKLAMCIRGDSEDGLINSKSSDARMLDCEFVVTGGKYNTKKLWQYLVITGGKLDSNGNSKAGNITRTTLRAILESSRGVKPNDTSVKAVKARQVQGYRDFNDMAFVAKVGIEKAKEGSGFKDKNKIQLVVTPDLPEYKIIMSGQEVIVKAQQTNSQKTNDAPGQNVWENNTNSSVENEPPPNNNESDDYGNSNDDNEKDVPIWAQ